jgi:signal transduction histidine kinase
MLDFSRMTNDHLKLEKSEFEFHSLLDSVVESMEPIAAERGQSLIIEPHTQPVWIVADHGRIVQIISNLINNSCKYSPTDTKITIIVQSASSQVSVTVSDHGVGIPPKDLESIYSPFFRSNQLKVREEIGTGLGLAISKSLVDLHDGTIEAKSVIDEGTDITVTLPGASDSPTVNAKA